MIKNKTVFFCILCHHYNSSKLPILPHIFHFIFLDKIKPEAAIISCGINNRYHHPSEKVMERLHEKNIKAIVTSEHGQIKIRSDGESFTIN